MNTENELAARILGDILAKGMSMSETDLSERVNSAAVSALDAIRLVMYNSELDERGKMAAVREIIKNTEFLESSCCIFCAYVLQWG